MRLSAVRLQNFRSYLDKQFELDSGVNIIVGPNGSGKTNLLEAILVLARGGSYRDRDNQLIKFGSDWARLDGTFDEQQRIVKYRLSGETVEKEIDIADKQYKRLSSDKAVPVVLFEPNDLALMIRGPEGRREYLDSILERTTPGYRPLKNHYKRAVSQRNTLLKHGINNRDQLFVWDVRISETGGQIVAARLALIDQLNQKISDIYSSAAGKKSLVVIAYKPTVGAANYSTNLLKKLEASADLDLRRGFTAYGPHREDFGVLLNDSPAEHTASRGETRSLILSLKIFELQLLEDTFHQKPIMLLDDVFSELDTKRRQALVGHLKNQQTVITTTDADAVLPNFKTKANVISLELSAR